MNFWSKHKLYFFALFLMCSVIAGHFFGILSPVEKYLSTSFDRILAANRSFSITVKNEYAFFKNKEEFFNETRSCFERVQNLSVDAARLDQLESENTLLKEQLDFKQHQTSTIILAQVIGEVSLNSQKIILVNRGLKDGVAVGQPVITGKGVLVGKILTTTEYTSHIRLIHDSKSKIEATVLNRDQTIGVVEGGFGISLQMKFVPRSEIIRVNQGIITSGREELIPRGLYIGTVTTVENEAYQGFQRLTLTPGVDLAKLSWVSIIVNR